MEFWFPLIRLAGLPVPRTEIVRHAGEDLLVLLDGREPEGFKELVLRLQKAAYGVSGKVPAFLRTAYLSGKHQWNACCNLSAFDEMTIGQHVFNLVEESALADIMGLPTDVWVVREMIETQPLFTCEAWEGFPVTREFRVRVGKQDEPDPPIFPYWPADSIEGAGPTKDDWRELLAEASKVSLADGYALESLARDAQAAVGGGFWSVDILQAKNGSWWVTDMAEGEKSWWPG